MSIADAICPSDPRPEIDSPNAVVAMRRGHSVSRDDDLLLLYLFPIFRVLMTGDKRNVDLALIDCHGYGKSDQSPCRVNGKKFWHRKRSAPRTPVFCSGKIVAFPSYGWNRNGSSRSAPY
jgi:hypothetical protein